MVFLEPDQYQPVADKIFNLIQARLRAALPASAEVEHIGSSSVPGLISKGDLDILVVSPVGELPYAAAVLRRLGFKPKMDTLRTEQLMPFESDRYPLAVAIQLIEKGSRFEFFRVFRDALLSDSALRAQYNTLKRASVALDESDYRSVKSGFIEQVLADREGERPTSC